MSSCTEEAFTQMIPERSLRQRMDALSYANTVRVYRANFKRDLKAGRRKLVEVLIDPPEMIEGAKIIDLLLATPKIGRVKADKLLRRAHISPSKTVGGMTERQRNELIALYRR
jgi:hypothetical protein